MLVKTLQEKGIGRPSTYGAIITALQVCKQEEEYIYIVWQADWQQWFHTGVHVCYGLTRQTWRGPSAAQQQLLRQ